MNDVSTHAVAPASPVAASTQAPSLIQAYYELTKPGITQMVALTTLTGYYLAIPGDVAVYAASSAHWMHFVATMVGTVCISAGSCVVNHVMERHADARMKRTAGRPIPSGAISVTSAWIFGAVLTLLGGVLLATTNPLTLALAVITWLVYIAVYTPLKKHSTLALLVGGIPGALPFAGGWTAVRGTLDVPAIALFAILFFWQMPHFLALSWMYRNDYREGGFAMLAAEENSGRSVGQQMVGYSILLVTALILPRVLGLTGTVYAIAAVALGLWLVFEGVRYLRKPDVPSARRVLLTSYAVLMGALILMVIDKASV
jgi:protoheme IX farnesyltransferase